ncbi:MAG: class I SAM-dependent methyltransferase [Anaerolineales bacterium]
MAKPVPANLLQEQLAYYRARAGEYDESVLRTGRFAGPGLPEVDAEWQHLIDAVRALPPCESALELACGTGIWTAKLLNIAETILALDGAAEMLEVNRAKVGSPRVTYQHVDLFHWQPASTYDLVLAGFWLSHVPPGLLPAHIEQVAKAVRPGGRLFFADEPAGGRQLSGPVEGEFKQTRSVHDGSSYRIVKVYHDPDALAAQLKPLGFAEVQIWRGDYFFYLDARRTV